ALFAQSSRALAIPGEGWLGGENALLATLVSQHADELLHLTELIREANLVAKNTNEALSLARVAVRTADAIMRYDINTLRQDAMAGIYDAFPDLRDFDNELGILVRNGEAITANDGSFFRLVDYHDEQARAVLRHGYRATIWPQVFPQAFKFVENPSPVDVLIQKRYAASGLAARHAYQQGVLAMLTSEAMDNWQDPNTKQNGTQLAAATTAIADLQNLANSTEMLNLKQQEVAAEERKRREGIALKGPLMNFWAANPRIFTQPLNRR